MLGLSSYSLSGGGFFDRRYQRESYRNTFSFLRKIVLLYESFMSVRVIFSPLGAL